MIGSLFFFLRNENSNLKKITREFTHLFEFEFSEKFSNNNLLYIYRDFLSRTNIDPREMEWGKGLMEKH